MNAKEHKRLLEEFISLGGNQRIANSGSSFSLKNYAKIKYELKKLQSCHNTAPTSPTVAEKTHPHALPKTIFKELIVDFPTELHGVYRKRLQLWLEACSMKYQLNDVAAEDDSQAMEIQWRIFMIFREFDKCQSILTHYTQYKRIMLSESERNFEGMSQLELYKERNNLRSLITRRKQTVKKLESELPDCQHERYKMKLHSLNLKKESLQKKIK